jgi:threonyl-tRNA synthetase
MKIPNQIAALLLANAVVELFPDVQMVGGEGTSKYFYYDFVFPFAFNDAFIPLIEERIRLILREKRPMRAMEMIPSNAATLMQHHRQSIAAEKLLQVERATVAMMQLGDFVAQCPPLPDLMLPHFKILEWNQFEDKTIRLIGAAAPDKQTLKERVKEQRVSHLGLAPEMGLCAPINGSWVWQPKGEILRQQLIRLWQTLMEKENFVFISAAARLNPVDYFQSFGETKFAEMRAIETNDLTDPRLGLLAPRAYFEGRGYRFCSEEKLIEEMISSLRFILKIPKILGFEFEIVLSVSSDQGKGKGKAVTLFREALENMSLDYTVEKEYRPDVLVSVDIRMMDVLGRWWTGPYVAAFAEKQCVLAISALGPLERTCALLLEKRGGYLPLWLAPEQVRILVAQSSADLYASEVYEALKTQGIRVTLDREGEKLKARLYNAALQKVPYVLLLGEREEKVKKLTIRAYDEEQSLSLDEFCNRLKREMESGNSEFKN